MPSNLPLQFLNINTSQQFLNTLQFQRDSPEEETQRQLQRLRRRSFEPFLIALRFNHQVLLKKGEKKKLFGRLACLIHRLTDLTHTLLRLLRGRFELP